MMFTFFKLFLSSILIIHSLSSAGSKKYFICDNVNCLVLFKQDEKNHKLISDDHVITDMLFLEVEELCSVFWNNNKYRFLINLKN